jgi:hypothetical protein
MKFFKFRKMHRFSGILFLSIAGFAFFFVACYPGFMSVDSLEQYRQAHTLEFADGHPPVMAWLWSKLNLVWEGPQSLLLLQLGVLWSGLYIWCINAGDSSRAKWFLLLGIAPWVANFEGVLWKDMGMAFSLLLALGLLGSERITRPQVFAVLILLLYAFMVRGNAPAALLPVIWYATVRLFPLLSHRIRILITVLSMLSMFAFLNFFNYHLLEAEENHMVSFVMVDDLVHLSMVTDNSLLPRVDFKTLKECSQETIGGTKLVGRLFCLITKPGYQNVAPIPFEEIKKEWVSAVASNPFEYVKFRLKAYLYLLRDPSERPYIYTFSGISPNDMGLSQTNNAATIILREYVRAIANVMPFVFKPYWWLIVALLFLCATLRMRGDKESLTLIRVLLVSAILYMLSYIPLTPMADLRYVYWSTLAISLAAIRFSTSGLSFKLDLLTKFRIN